MSRKLWSRRFKGCC